MQMNSESKCCFVLPRVLLYDSDEDSDGIKSGAKFCDIFEDGNGNLSQQFRRQVSSRANDMTLQERRHNAEMLQMYYS